MRLIFSRVSSRPYRVKNRYWVVVLTLDDTRMQHCQQYFYQYGLLATLEYLHYHRTSLGWGIVLQEIGTYELLRYGLQHAYLRTIKFLTSTVGGTALLMVAKKEVGWLTLGTAHFRCEVTPLVAKGLLYRLFLLIEAILEDDKTTQTMLDRLPRGVALPTQPLEELPED